jgi:4'-phosphopantetheinyl transferase EntD
MFQTLNFSGKESVIKATYKGTMQKFGKGLCPVAEKIQKEILAFKTNYWDWNRALKQAEILKNTIEFYDKK